MIRPLAAVAAALLLACPSTSQGEASDSVLAAIRTALVHNRILAAAAQRCVIYREDEDTPAHLDIAVIERHGGACPGDPATAPVVAFVRYEKRSGRILVEDQMTGDYKPLR